MSDFAETWSLVRGRFDASVLDLSQVQLNWRLHPNTLTLGEMAIHVAGVEVSFISQILGKAVDGDLERIRKAATDGSVNDLPFPFSPEEISPELVRYALDEGRKLVESTIHAITPEVRSAQVKSALGPIVDGTGAFARLAYHPGYHQGQAYMIRSAPGFPSA